LFLSIFKSLNGGFGPPFFAENNGKENAFSGASFQRLWGAFIGEANRLKCLKRRLSDLLSA
jgi:hypothetical protein